MTILGFPAQQRENGSESTTSRLRGTLPDCTGLETWPKQSRSYSQDSQTPVTKKGIGRLNTTMNYLTTCKFLLNLSQVIEPLRRLTQKGIEWYWGKAEERAFTEVKQLVTQAPVLTYMYLKQKKKLVIQCDASSLLLCVACWGPRHLQWVCSRECSSIPSHRVQRSLDVHCKTERNRTIEVLNTNILKGWSEDKSRVPPLVTPYYSVRDSSVSMMV